MYICSFSSQLSLSPGKPEGSIRTGRGARKALPQAQGSEKGKRGNCVVFGHLGPENCPGHLNHIRTAGARVESGARARGHQGRPAPPHHPVNPTPSTINCKP